ncbi:MAG TPA: glucose-1-phosphate thymidylyltransferase [Candidatus Marinimicrobia bacterium]|nr:glucose-1-phosphate thymidylyltransferase [Candidatus Neomarinimicrobiota bacterium]HRS50925.1 glucose-1-phosphate thymidylyltransferase [Candidatus Neomarinimicrobiota bacterium]
MKALITAGGHGTRLRPITHTQNKHLIPIANKPILNYALEYVRDAGIHEVGIITNKEGNEVREVYGDGQAFGLKIVYIPQERPAGLADCVRIAESFIGTEPFVFYLGDNIIIGGIRRFIEEFERNQTNCHLVLAKVPDPERFGVPEIKGNRIVSIVEKPKKPLSDFAVTGIYIYDHTIFEAVNNIQPSERGELEISDAHQYLLNKGYKVTFSEITGWWKDTGKPSDLLEANRLVLDNITTSIQGKVDQNSQISGRVVISQGAEIINSNIRGPVIIGEGAKIINAYIGPYTAIDKNCKISNAEIEYSIVSCNCVIRNQKIRIEASLLGKNVQIVESQAKPFTNRFIIGDQSVIEIRQT